MAKMFGKVGKKACNLILNEGDLTTIMKLLETNKLNHKMNVLSGDLDGEMVIEFKSNFSGWEALVLDIVAECKSKVYTMITDQFGETHSIELT